MPLPYWLRSQVVYSHLLAQSSPHWQFATFADAVARLLDLPPTMVTGEFERSSETKHVWLLWKSDVDGASLCLDRPDSVLREAVVIKVWWHQSPDPADVAAMVRAYERRGRRRTLLSLLAKVIRRH